MKWNYGNLACMSLTPSEFDLQQDLLKSTYDALRIGLVEMSKSELVDFNSLCDKAELHLRPLQTDNIPALRRIK